MFERLILILVLHLTIAKLYPCVYEVVNDWRRWRKCLRLNTLGALLCRHKCRNSLSLHRPFYIWPRTTFKATSVSSACVHLVFALLALQILLFVMSLLPYFTVPLSPTFFKPTFGAFGSSKRSSIAFIAIGQQMPYGSLCALACICADKALDLLKNSLIRSWWWNYADECTLK